MTNTGKPREPRLSAFFSPIQEAVLEADRAAALLEEEELERELDADIAVHSRQIVLSQRAWRIIFVSVLAGIAAIGGAAYGAVYLLLVLGVYGALVLGLPILLRDTRKRSLRSIHALPTAVTLADLLVLAAVFQPTSSPLGDGLLISGLIVVWLAGHHFGWRVAAVASIGTGAIYLLLTADQPMEARRVQGVGVALFLVASTAITLEQARFRSNMRQLRIFCRRVASGDVGLRLGLTAAPDGDQILSLSRDVDAMRKGLAEQIGHDALTGCLNRRALESRLRGECRLARRRESVLSVLVIDVDRFKQINDTHGHHVGDQVLRQMADIMKSVARDSDIVARLGGDEFVIALPDTDRAGAGVVAERLRIRVSDSQFGSESDPVSVTLSIGAAFTDRANEASPAEILAAADRALYRSKQQGRNRVSISS